MDHLQANERVELHANPFHENQRFRRFMLLPGTVPQAQTDLNRAYRDFPLVVSLQFHCFALPGKDLLSNFSNIGIGLGTEVSFSGQQNWVQQISAVWYHNRAMGNGLLFYTQTAWRPSLGSNAFAEMKAGVGYLYSFRPNTALRQVEGQWTSVAHRGKGMLAVPVGVAAGTNLYSSGANISPFVGYQFLVLRGYNMSMPIVPETLVQAGTRIHFNP